MGASLVGGGDPQEQPELVAGGRRGRERRDPGPGTRGEGGLSGGDARPASGRTSVPVPLHPVDPALSLVD